MAGSNGHVAMQIILPRITRLITKDVLDGSQARLVWISEDVSPVNPQLKIGKMFFRFDADDKPCAVEVYCLGMIENRIIGVRTTIRIEDVLCTDEVMDANTWKEEIEEAEGDDEDEPEDLEPEPEIAAAVPVATQHAPPPATAASLPAPSIPAA